ncbi:hypothetical protein CDL15_Pgr016979 [Punica granatum]|uniref:Receptor-like serine/threonine-protein kinase n=1 Tax=Punica granatum TaxID=22663 RepID=A0A218WZC1_PUNGR|nr:hypothetical protein CDL15_Pgr016979 [Punica granatum]
MWFPFPLLLVHCSILVISFGVAESSDTLSFNQTLSDGQTLVSSGQVFELGFFSPGTSRNRYLGMWYRNLTPTYVWVANRNDPIVNSTAELALTQDGSLSLRNGSTSYWSVNTTAGASLQLLDDGNLVLKDDSGNYLWQSYDNVTDTLLPGMKLGWSLEKGLVRNMTSWASSTDPSSGQFTFSLDPPESPQLVLRKDGQKLYRWGPWNGVRFSGSNELRANPVFDPMFNSSPLEVYYSYQVVEDSVVSRFLLTWDGLIQYLSWRNSNEWTLMVTLQRDECDTYRKCGPFGSCYSGDTICKCLEGFLPTSPQNWNSVDWTDGCTRKWELDCRNGDGFVKYKDLKLPDNSRLSSNRSLSLEECEMECLNNCSCTAFTRIDIHGNGGDCVLWFEELIDMKNYPDGGDVLYIRMARAELDALADAKRKRLIRRAIGITLSVVCGLLTIGFIVWFILRKMRLKKRAAFERMLCQIPPERNEEDLELPLFDLVTINSATNEFSSENKIGQGGFGKVYKGALSSGKEIAVKRLSLDSGQGIQEFKNEVILIAKLQHRNLVKLLGCCIQGEERMLIYEFMPNKSLDHHLFDKTRSKLLSWDKRFNIIMGIARGLLYLHQDSRLRIIHRDLKPSNILLDSQMNPKISDFGIARIFQVNYMIISICSGYIAPEYALRGHISVKSDVFSFGVLVLEIVSGKKIMGFSQPDNDLNLLGYAWKLWNEGNPLELVDEAIGEPFPLKEVVRCIQVGLLCAQLRAEDRPMMSTVVLMLGNENFEVPQPKEPGFKNESMFIGSDSSSSANNNLHTFNEITITNLDGR